MFDFDFDPEKFRELTNERGESIRWHKGIVCPCTDPMTANRNRECPLCFGVGFAYSVDAELAGFKALIRQVDERKEFAKYGQLYLGDITISTMPDELPIGENDLVDLLERRFRREEVITRGTGTTDVLHWIPQAELISVRSVATEYIIGTDVELDSDLLSWLDNEPATGTRLTVVYDWIPRYIVVPSMIAKRRVVNNVDMPQRVVARLKDREDFRS